MPRFNPFNRLNCRHGAPMGRHGDDAGTYDGSSKLYARHSGGDGYYDRGGAYWGHSKVCAVWTRGGEWCAYVEAYSPDAAIYTVRLMALGLEVRHDAYGYYLCTDDEAAHEDAGNASAGFDGRAHFNTIRDAQEHAISVAAS